MYKKEAWVIGSLFGHAKDFLSELGKLHFSNSHTEIHVSISTWFSDVPQNWQLPLFLENVICDAVTYTEQVSGSGSQWLHFHNWEPKQSIASLYHFDYEIFEFLTFEMEAAYLGAIVWIWMSNIWALRIVFFPVQSDFQFLSVK